MKYKKKEVGKIFSNIFLGGGDGNKRRKKKKKERKEMDVSHIEESN